MPTKTEPDLKEFLTTREVAELYGIKQVEVQKAIKRELIRAQKVVYFYVIWEPSLPEFWPTSA